MSTYEMPTKEDLAMTKWNGIVPQVQVSDITVPPALEIHMTTDTAVMSILLSILLIIIMFVMSVLSWYYSLSGKGEEHPIVYAITGLLSSFLAGLLISNTLHYW